MWSIHFVSTFKDVNLIKGSLKLPKDLIKQSLMPIFSKERCLICSEPASGSGYLEPRTILEAIKELEKNTGGEI